MTRRRVLPRHAAVYEMVVIAFIFDPLRKTLDSRAALSYNVKQLFVNFSMTLYVLL
jgi:hypothetical protein